MTAVAAVAAVPAVRREARPARPARTVWWTTPAGCVLLVVPLTLLLALTIPAHDYAFFYRVQKAITGRDAALYLLGAAVLVAGTALPLVAGRSLPRTAPTLDAVRLRGLDRAAGIAFWLTVVGYLAFAAIGAARGATPSLLLHAVTQQSNYGGRFKELFAPVAGVTSLTQVGIAYVVLAGVLRAHGVGRHAGRRLAVIVVLGLLRAYFLTERLAVLELLVPLVVVIVAGRRRAPRRQVWWQGAPVVAVPLLAVVFGAFEYSRSWQYFKTRTDLSFPRFAVNRLAGYYATAYDNGSLQLRYGAHLHRLPYDSIQGIWTSPGPAQLHLYQRITGVTGTSSFDAVLARHGNPEFNNPGGLAVPFVDFGVAGGLVFLLVSGVVIGLAYQGFRRGSTVGLLVYPVLFTGLLELPRYVYWTQGRVVPAYVVLLVTAWLIRGRRARR